MFQMKEQDKTSETELNEVETGNLPDREFKVMIAKMTKELWEKLFDEIRTFDSVEFIKVKGHVGNKYNEIADNLANKEAVSYGQKEDVQH